MVQPARPRHRRQRRPVPATCSTTTRPSTPAGAGSPATGSTRSAVARLEDAIRAVVVELIEEVRPAGHAELYRDIALPLPVTSFCAILGIDLADRDRFLDWADELVVAMAYPERGRGPARSSSAFTTAEVERRRGPADAGRGDELPPGLLSHLAVDEYSDDGERDAAAARSSTWSTSCSSPATRRRRR